MEHALRFDFWKTLGGLIALASILLVAGRIVSDLQREVSEIRARQLIVIDTIRDLRQDLQELRRNLQTVERELAVERMRSIDEDRKRR